MTRSWLIDRLASWGDHPAFMSSRGTLSYAQLGEGVRRWQARLRTGDLAGARVVAVESDTSPAACALLLALIEEGSIAVPLGEMPAEERTRSVDVAQAEVVVSLDAADGATVTRTGHEPTSSLTTSLLASGRPGLVLFSSGSTGVTKAALHDLDTLMEKFQAPRHRLRTCAFLLFDHIGGVNTTLYTLANGGCLGIPLSRNPDDVCRAICEYRLQLLPTSPTFLNLLLISEAYRRYDLSSLELITYGTEVMPKATLERLAEALPSTRLQQTYGLSEVGILRSKSRADDSLWVKIGGESFETKIVGGTLRIRARSAMLGYLNAPSPFDADGWLDTGDVVEVDGEWIRFLGRRSDVINVGGQKVFPAEVEGVLLEFPGIRDATVHGEKNPITGEIVVARVILEKDEKRADLRRRLRSWCRQRLAAYKIPARIIVTDDVGVTSRQKKIRPPKTMAQPTE